MAPLASPGIDYRVRKAIPLSVCARGSLASQRKVRVRLRVRLRVRSAGCNVANDELRSDLRSTVNAEGSVWEIAKRSRGAPTKKRFASSCSPIRRIGRSNRFGFCFNVRSALFFFWLATACWRSTIDRMEIDGKSLDRANRLTDRNLIIWIKSFDSLDSEFQMNCVSDAHSLKFGTFVMIF